MNAMLFTDSCLSCSAGCWNQLIGGWVLFIYIFVDMLIAEIHAILYRVARTRKGGLRCTSWTCLKDVMGNANILWFAQAVDDSGEFGSFKLMENLARFLRFACCFGSYQQAMCLFQLVHWNFVEHGP